MQKKTRTRRWGRAILVGVLALFALCFGLAAISALANRNLPTHSAVIDRLVELEKARLAEAVRLRQTLGEAVWPGWNQADIPVCVYNEEYAFLVGYADPPAGWVKVPNHELRGGPWELVPADTYEGQHYYRQLLSDPEITPENFTVLVGERWVATLQTKEYGEVAFIAGFGEELPAPLRPIFPYRLVWGFLGGDTEVYIGALVHEAFHAYQGTVAPERLAQAERSSGLEDQYPWDDQVSEGAWQEELDLLYQAVQAETDDETAELAGQFLARRERRRVDVGLAPSLVGFEQKREWLEGLAKYAELSLLRQGATAAGYEPMPSLAADPGFDRYAGMARLWSQQLGEVRRLSGREGDTRFYYSGMVQAVLLDRLMPGWKLRVMELEVWLEDLLAEAIGG